MSIVFVLILVVEQPSGLMVENIKKVYATANQCNRGKLLIKKEGFAGTPVCVPMEVLSEQR